MKLRFRFYTSAVPLLLPAMATAEPLDAALALPFHTQFFLGAIALLILWFAVIRFDRFAVAHGPEILTTVGIFGCFFGISLGLLNFDTADIGKSVPLLLDGIRTAFWASLAGIFGALVVKARHALATTPIPQSGATPKSATMDDLVAMFYKVQQGLVGDDEGTLLGQMKLMRQDQRDGVKSLSESFDNFASRMADNNSKALIEALKEVIRDFNAKINEQFGENFKQLNQAVEKLVIWQQQYKEELEQVKAAQKQAASDMHLAAQAFANIADRSEVYTKTAEKLGSLLSVMDGELTRILKTEKALHDALADMRLVVPTFAEKSGALLDDIRQGHSKVSGECEATAKALAASMQAANAEMRKAVSESITESHKQVSAHVKALSEDTKNQVIALDKALDRELTRALETLGQQLTALSRKFVDDYTPLTEKLQRVLQIARAN